MNNQHSILVLYNQYICHAEIDFSQTFQMLYIYSTRVCDY